MFSSVSAERLQERIGQFKYLVHERINRLQNITDQLLKSAEEFHDVHHNNTIGSLSGNVIGAAGGITATVGLILAPFTLGASLIVTGVGIGLGVSGGVVGAVSNIKGNINKSEVKESIEKLLAEFQMLMEPIEENLKVIESDLRALKHKDQGWKIAGLSGALLGNIIRLSKLSTISLRSALRFSVVLSGLLAIVDIAFIWADARELHEMSRERRRHAKTETLKFIKSIEDTASSCQQAVNELRELGRAFDM